MATQLKKTVKPSGGDYTSLEACMNANEQNLVTADQYFDVEIDGSWSSADTTAVTIHNYTTDATRYINIYTTATARHQGKISSSAYSLTVNTAGNVIAIDYMYGSITGLQIQNTATACEIVSITGSTTATMLFSKNIINGGGLNHNAFVNRNNGHTVNMFNNIVQGCNNVGITNVSGTINAYNNTIYNCSLSLYRSGGTLVGINNICQAASTKEDYDTVLSAGSGYNVILKNNADAYSGTEADSGTTDSTSANKLIQSGQNFLTTVKVGMLVKNTTDTQYSYVTAVDSDTQLSVANDYFASGKAYTIYTNRIGNVAFVDETGTYDLHLDATNPLALDVGYDLSGTFTDDIDGVTRSGTWDIGADEYVAAATGGGSRMMLIGMGA